MKNVCASHVTCYMPIVQCFQSFQRLQSGVKKHTECGNTVLCIVSQVCDEADVESAALRAPEVGCVVVPPMMSSLACRMGARLLTIAMTTPRAATLSAFSTSCHCGKCVVSIAEGATPIAHSICHCSTCRSLSGAPFLVSVACPPAFSNHRRFRDFKCQ